MEAISVMEQAPLRIPQQQCCPPCLSDGNKLGSGKSQVSANPYHQPLPSPGSTVPPPHVMGATAARRSQHLMGLENGIKNTVTVLDTPLTHIPDALTQGGTSKAANPHNQMTDMDRIT